MSAENSRAKREESFTLSMVDLFGCGFIAAIFLFILNVLQPQIEAADAKASTTILSTGGQGEGQSGPVLISIKSEELLHFTTWPTKDGTPVGTSRGFSREDKFKYTYDEVLPDAAGLKWPLQFVFCAKSDLPEGGCAGTKSSSQFQVVLRAVLGNSTATAYFVSEKVGDVISVSVAAHKNLMVKAKRDYEHSTTLDLLPEQKNNIAYYSTSTFFSSAPFTAAAGWAGGVERIAIGSKNKPAITRTVPNLACWLFVGSDVTEGLVACPHDTDEIANTVGEEPWRSGVFAQAIGMCTFPFDQYLCQWKATDGSPPPCDLPDQTAAAIAKYTDCIISRLLLGLR